MVRTAYIYTHSSTWINCIINYCLIIWCICIWPICIMICTIIRIIDCIAFNPCIIRIACHNTKTRNIIHSIVDYSVIIIVGAIDHINSIIVVGIVYCIVDYCNVVKVFVYINTVMSTITNYIVAYNNMVIVRAPTNPDTIAATSPWFCSTNNSVIIDKAMMCIIYDRNSTIATSWSWRSPAIFYTVICYHKIRWIRKKHSCWALICLAIIHSNIVCVCRAYWIVTTFIKMPEVIEFTVWNIIICAPININSIMILSEF